MKLFKNFYFIWTILLILLIILIFIVPNFLFSYWNDQTKFADATGFVSAFSTSIASLAAIATLIFYGNQIKLQSDDLKETKNRQKKTEEYLLEIAKTINEMNIISDKNLKLKKILNLIEFKKIELELLKKNSTNMMKINKIEIEIKNFESELIKELSK